MKFSFVKLLGIAAIAIFTSSCNNEAAKTEMPTSGFSLDSAKAAIAESNKTFGAGFTTGDSAAFVSHYASDGCISPSNMPRMCGTQAITAFFNGGYAMGIRNIALITEEVMGGKDAVVETGKYEMFAANNVSIDKGKFIVIWKEENGKWKMYRDIWNTDMPPATPSK